MRHFPSVGMFWILALSASGSLLGQSTDSPLDINFTAYSLVQNIKDLSYVSDGQVYSFDVPSRYRSKEQHYRGNGEVTFFKGGLDAEGRPVDVVATLTINQTFKYPLFIFAENQGQYRIMQIEDDKNQFPVGSIRFLNFTDRQLNMLIGDDLAGEKQVIQPFGMVDYQMKDNDVGNLRVRIADYFYDTPAIFLDSRVFPDRSFRYLYFIWQPEQLRPRARLSLLKERMIRVSVSPSGTPSQ